MNDATDYARLKVAFLELIEMDAAACEQRLAHWDARDPQLAAALRQQLHAATQSVPVLDCTADASNVPALPNYTLIRELGRGGMGVVWLAERALEDARQPVALKRIAQTHWSEDDLRRFQRERRILATLDHPNIAALVDGGTDAHGVAYIATQYVDGQRIDRWCKTQALDVRARVRLLREVVVAVAHAHARLIVHRDLKPDNILVTRDGVPKLLDFGIARALHEDAVTIDGPSQMTLRYAAPEQVASEGGEHGVGVDVYALGVLLYETLACASPYAGASGPAALVQAILHDDPAPPSRLRTALPGVDADLDAICLKALRKRPDERYAGAADLLADLDRWLRREAVEARRGERGYRLRSFVRRRWPWLAAACLVLAAGAGFAAITLHQTRLRLTLVEHERDKAQAVAQFLQELFLAATPNEIAAGQLSARDLLRRSVARLQEGSVVSMDEDARAAMHYTAARILHRQGLHEEAANLYETAISLWRNLPQPARRDLITALHNRAHLEFAAGRLDQALHWQRQALAECNAAGDVAGAARAHVLNQLATFLDQTGQREAAMQALHEAADILHALPGQQSAFALVQGNLAAFSLYAGMPEQALMHARTGSAELAAIRPERTAQALGLARLEAAALRELGRHDEAERLYLNVLRRTREELSTDSLDEAETRHSLAQLYLLQQRWHDADTALRQAERIHTVRGGALHPRALTARADRSRILIAQGRYAEAEAELRDVMKHRRDSSGDRASLAAERTAHAYTTCRNAVAATPAHLAELDDAIAAMQRDPPLPRQRLAEVQAWRRACAEMVSNLPTPGRTSSAQQNAP